MYNGWVHIKSQAVVYVYKYFFELTSVPGVSYCSAYAYRFTSLSTSDCTKAVDLSLCDQRELSCLKVGS